MGRFHVHADGTGHIHEHDFDHAGTPLPDRRDLRRDRLADDLEIEPHDVGRAQALELGEAAASGEGGEDLRRAFGLARLAAGRARGGHGEGLRGGYE